MNKVRRSKLHEACRLLGQAATIVERAKDEEQDCLDGLPENLQSSERAEAMADAIAEMDEAIDKINEATENIDRAQS